LDSEIDAVIFSTITKDDLVSEGALRPMGARHFSERANMLQNVISLTNSALAADPAVKVHLSGKKLAKLLEELVDLDMFKIFGSNVRVFENSETQQLMQKAQEQSDVSAATPAGILPHDKEAPVEGVKPGQIGMFSNQDASPLTQAKGIPSRNNLSIPQR
jgi:hypothetical protein